MVSDKTLITWHWWEIEFCSFWVASYIFRKYVREWQQGWLPKWQVPPAFKQIDLVILQLPTRKSLCKGVLLNHRLSDFTHLSWPVRQGHWALMDWVCSLWPDSPLKKEKSVVPRKLEAVGGVIVIDDTVSCAGSNYPRTWISQNGLSGLWASVPGLVSTLKALHFPGSKGVLLAAVSLTWGFDKWERKRQWCLTRASRRVTRMTTVIYWEPSTI